MSKIKLRIHTWPEKILRKKCRKVERIDSSISELLNEMYSFMRLSNGVGLAANQVGFDLSLIVAEWQDRVFKLVNPCIVKKQGSISSNEGCLSFPGIELEIKRSERIWVSALNEKGEPVELEIEGILAVIFQHEIDHSEGKVFIERIPFWQKLKIHPKLEELSRRTRDGLRQQK